MGEEDTSRPESRVSQSADEDDSNSFHDVDETNNDNDNSSPPSPTHSPPDHVADNDKNEDEEKLEKEKEGEPANDSPPPPDQLDPPPATVSSTAMSSTTSLHLAQQDALPSTATTDELVAFLRGQITDLTSQVTSLNGKLVKSYTTRGDLEDTLHDTQEMERQLKKRVKDLETDKEKWTKEIEQGGWVERDHVQGEMQRLMHKVVEETQNRQTAVQAHSALENEVENLTSNLFAEANKMVAFERLARARAEDKTRQVEEAGTSMQALLEDVQVGLRDTVTKLEKREQEIGELKRRLAVHGEIVPEDPTERNGEGGAGEGTGEEGDLGGSIIFSDGQHLDVATTLNSAPTPAAVRDLSQAPIPSQFASPRLLTSALPYQEFLTFITYLRQLRVTTLARPPDPPSAFGAARGFGSEPPLPASMSPAQLLAPHLLLSTHLSQPFLKRCVEEDSDPALRLDLAPGLGFLSRRNVANAVVDGTLLIEPLGHGQELQSEKCSLCGCGLEKWFANSGVSMNRTKSTGGGSNSTTGVPTTTDQLNQTMKKMLGGRGWGFTRSNSKDTTPTLSTTSPSPSSTTNNTPADTSFSFPSYSPSHHPLDHSLQIHIFKIKDTATSRYPICPSYCLARLRAVCEFWTYVRVIERGLLLEEGFKFVRGRNDTISRQNSSAELNKVRSTNGSTVEVDQSKGDAGDLGASEENRGLGIEARDFEAADTEMEGTPRIVEPEPDEDVEEKKDSTEEAEGEKKEGEESKSEETPASSLPASPAISRPQTPNNGLTQNSNASSGSLNKPNRPPRSSARASPAIGSSSSPPASPSFPPTLPPRKNPSAAAPPPRHPSQQQQTSQQAGGEKTGGDLIANSTGWEDRCWSEVVRLKESVFWTRVAAVSSDGGFVSARGAKVWVQVAKIAVIYYTLYGHVSTLALAEAEAARSTGAEVDIYRFPEILSDEVRGKMHAGPHNAEHPEITPDDLLKYDGYLMGFGTRYGRAPAAVSAFFDQTGGLWAKGQLFAKCAGIFTSSASQHGGQETTALTTLPFFAHHGIIYIPSGFAAQELTDLTEIVGGSAWGAAAIAGGDGSRQVTEKELAVAKFQGSSFAKTVSQFVAGKSALEKQQHTGEPALAKALPASAVATGTTPENTTSGYEVADKAPEPAATESAPVTESASPAAAPSTEAAPTPAATEKPAAATPAPAAAAQPKQQQKKKGGLFSCCGKPENYDS